MVTVDEFSRLVSGIYAAALTPRHWESAIRDIHRALGAVGGALMTPDRFDPELDPSILPAGAAQSYAEHYSHVDHVLAAVENGPVGAVRTGTELIAPKRNTEFCADWLRPYDLEDGLFVRLDGGPRPTCFVVGSPRRTEPFDTPERVKLMNGLVVHLQQALRTQDKLAALGHSTVDLAGALEAVRHGVIIVGSGCWVIILNSAAEAILSADDGVQIRSGRIAATSMHAERELHCAIHHALTEDGSKVRRGQSFTCERPSGKRPYVIHVLPLHCAGTDETLRQATALMLIIDPEHKPDAPVELLRRLYGLTNTEAQVAVRIGRGADLKQISDELVVSSTTVRTHLQHIFDKTDTHRQAELVQHLLAVSP